MWYFTVVHRFFCMPVTRRTISGMYIGQYQCIDSSLKFCIGMVLGNRNRWGGGFCWTCMDCLWIEEKECWELWKYLHQKPAVMGTHGGQIAQEHPLATKVTAPFVRKLHRRQARATILMACDRPTGLMSHQTVSNVKTMYQTLCVCEDSPEAATFKICIKVPKKCEYSCTFFRPGSRPLKWDSSVSTRYRTKCFDWVVVSRRAAVELHHLHPESLKLMDHICVHIKGYKGNLVAISMDQCKNAWILSSLKLGTQS